MEHLAIEYVHQVVHLTSLVIATDLDLGDGEELTIISEGLRLLLILFQVHCLHSTVVKVRMLRFQKSQGFHQVTGLNLPSISGRCDCLRQP